MTIKYTVMHEVHGTQTMHVPYKQRHDVEMFLLEGNWFVVSTEIV